MPDLDLTNWLSAGDIDGDTELVFMDEGKQVEMNVGNNLPTKTVFEIGVKLPNGDERSWTMNKTSQRAIAQTYGNSTQTWTGKKAVVFVSEQNVNNVMKNVIYARVPAKTE